VIVDLRSAPDAASFAADVCIIGAGPAGITLALELMKRGVAVIVAESGGLDFDPDVQDLAIGTTIGDPYRPLDTSRLRMFGGSSNHWQGNCSMLAPIDFEARDWLPWSGWPFEFSELAPFYRLAAAYCELDPDLFELERWIQEEENGVPAIESRKLTYGVALGSPPTRFGDVYGPQLESSGSSRVLLHATLVDLELDHSLAKVRTAVLQTLTGKVARVDAKAFVLAAGGLENPRLLLAINRQISSGIGNAHDVVGRFYMDHPVIEGAALLTDADFGQRFRADDGRLFFRLTEEKQRADELLDARMPLISATRYRLSPGVESFHQAMGLLREAHLGGELWAHVGRMVSDWDLVLEAAGRRLFSRRFFDSAEAFGGFLIDTMTEQRPDPANRVVLTDERDALDMPRIQLHWRLLEEDLDNLERVYKVLGAEIGRLGWGRIHLRGADDTAGRLTGELLSHPHHHMGGTRASADPRRGVVDAELAVHGMANLFIAGSSVFPTGGCVPPTLTIVALSCRLAGHVASRLPSL
jgi:choline dehydrogenase-like flavoprotein